MSIVTLMDEWPSRAWIALGWMPAAMSRLACVWRVRQDQVLVYECVN
jgi:hypothetical protein